MLFVPVSTAYTDVVKNPNPHNARREKKQLNLGPPPLLAIKRTILSNKNCQVYFDLANLFLNH